MSDSTDNDLSALAWVHGELRRSLETANKALRRYLKEADAARGSDVDAVDPAVLRTARSQLHQGVGALELVGMPAVADVLRAAEAAVQRMVARPAVVDAAAVDTVERVSFALLDFLGRQLAGKPVSPVLLFPQYRAVLQLAGVDRIHPADLWKVDWVWRDLPADATATPRNADDAARSEMETLVLALMRLPAADGTTAAAAAADFRDTQYGSGRDTLARMSDLCADLGAGARLTGAGGPHAATFWQLAAAVFQAQAAGLLVADVYSKRLASRLMAQLRMRMKGDDSISDRLAQDLLFFCSHAQAPQAGTTAPRLHAVRQAWRLDTLPTGDYDTPRLGRFDPAVLALARKRVAAAKDSWSAVAGGELHRMAGLAEQFVLVGESLQRLLPAGDVLARALQTAVAQTVASDQAPPPALAMEVATGILYLDASLDDGEFDHPELPERVHHLARRIDDVRIGAEPQPLDMWMEELYRRVSDRQTMGSVVQELRASLSEIEKQIDQYFRDPSQRQLLIPVPAQLSAMRGVLSVLGLEQASAAALHMRDEVDALAQTEVDPARAIQAGTFDRLADNLGALSFLIDMLAVQPVLAKSLFRYDPDTGHFSVVMGQTERVSAFAAFDEAAALAVTPAPAASTAPLMDQLQALAHSAALPSVSDADIARQLEPLVQQAEAAGQPDLSQLLASAQHALGGAALSSDAASDASDTSTRVEVRKALAHAVASLAPPAVPELPPSAPIPPAVLPTVASTAPAASGSGSGLEDDAEMREIFIEEAQEVIADANAALQRLADVPDNGGDMTTVRRAFHTLKGSARMVGLRDFGDAGWACEQLYNARLASAPRVDAPLREFSVEALAYMADWTEAIAAGRQGGHTAAAVSQAADALREHGTRMHIALPEVVEGAGSAAAVDTAAATVQPSAGGHGEAVLDTTSALHAPAAVPAPTAGPAPVAGALLDLQFDPLEEDGAALAPAEPASPAELDLPPLDLQELDALPDSEHARTQVLEPRPTTSLADLPTTVDLPDLPDLGALDLDFDTLIPDATASPLPAPDVQDVDFDLALDLELDLDNGSQPQPAAPPAVPVADEAPLPVTAAKPAADPTAAQPSPFDALLQGLNDLPLRAAPGGFTPLPEAPADDDLLLDDDAPSQDATTTDLPLPAAEALELDLAELDRVFAAAPELVAPPPGAEALPDLALDLSALSADLSSEPIGDFAEPLVASTPAVPEPTEAVQASEGDHGDHGDNVNTDDAVLDGDEPVKVIGPLRIGIPLFNIYLNEADELSRRLGTELAEWAHEHTRHPVPASSVALAHSLAGSSATVGYADLSALARALEHALERSQANGHGLDGEPALFNDVADEIRRLLHQFAAGFLRPVAPALLERLADHERWPAPVPQVDDAALDADVDAVVDAEASVTEDDVDTDAALDAIDVELFPIFEEEADELLPQLHERLRDWAARPDEHDAAMACMRTLHTVKGGARLAGAMRLGDMAHRLEARIETLAERGNATLHEVEPLLGRADAMSAEFDRLRRAQHHGTPVAAPAPAVEAERVVAPLAVEPTAAEQWMDLSGVDVLPVDVQPDTQPEAVTQAQVPETDSAPTTPLEDAESSEPASAASFDAPSALAVTPSPTPANEPQDEPANESTTQHASKPTGPAPIGIDWQRFAAAAAATTTAEPQPATATAAATNAPSATAGAVVRVRAGLLDRMVNQAGEVSIARARITSDVKQMQGALGELTDSLERMRRQLRDIEVQAESQISSRLEAAKASAAAFDPLEMDRFTRFQELTRFMAESVNDVATLQRGLQRTLQSTEDELAAQARLTRELQDDLLRTRMVDFDSMADRLHRTARQAARDSGKQVRLDIVGGSIEVDRGVLERMAGPFEHLLRNSVAHGIETPEARTRTGKAPGGVVTVSVAQAGNEVAVEFADDGGGLDLARIRQRGLARGLIADGDTPDDAALSQLIFQPGFSTADSVTELAGRGVGLDVVRAEVNAMGGRVQTSSDAGRGTRFKLLLPLTTAVTQVVMLRFGKLQVAVPSTLIEVVQRATTEDVERAYEDGHLAFEGEQVPFFWLPALLRVGNRGELPGRTQAVVVIRSAAQRVALHVDEVVGNQEVVVKNVGPQLSRLPGLAGVTLLPSGAVALIYNPVALAALYGDAAHARMRLQAPAAAETSPAETQARAPLVMVVDDSLTVRRVTQRLLLREGYRVVTAKDGLDALEKLAEERPVILLSDIEMPRMDGFDLLRNVRAEPRLAGLPVVMITSRTAQKHRDYAAELGADHYLGKPYAEDELLALVARHAGADVAA